MRPFIVFLQLTCAAVLCQLTSSIVHFEDTQTGRVYSVDMNEADLSAYDTYELRYVDANGKLVKPAAAAQLQAVDAEEEEIEVDPEAEEFEVNQLGVGSPFGFGAQGLGAFNNPQEGKLILLKALLASQGGIGKGGYGGFGGVGGYGAGFGGGGVPVVVVPKPQFAAQQVPQVISSVAPAQVSTLPAVYAQTTHTASQQVIPAVIPTQKPFIQQQTAAPIVKPTVYSQMPVQTAPAVFGKSTVQPIGGGVTVNGGENGGGGGDGDEGENDEVNGGADNGAAANGGAQSHTTIPAAFAAQIQQFPTHKKHYATQLPAAQFGVGVPLSQQFPQLKAQRQV